MTFEKASLTLKDSSNYKSKVLEVSQGKSRLFDSTLLVNEPWILPLLGNQVKVE